MKDIMYQELKTTSTSVQELRERLAEPYIQVQEGLVFELISHIVELARAWDKGGMDALADADSMLPAGELVDIWIKGGMDALIKAEKQMPLDQSAFRFLPLVTEIAKEVENTEKAEEISMATYFSHTLDGYDALRFLLCHEGIFAIMRGEPTCTVEQRMKSLLPPQVAEAYAEYASEK